MFKQEAKPLPSLENKDAVYSLSGLSKFYEKKELPKPEWTVDPLRLCLEKEEKEECDLPFQQEIDLPFRFKPKTKDVYHRLLSLLHVSIASDTEYAALVNELPFATADQFAPTPPLKEPTTTPPYSPPTILPFESYASVYNETDTWDSKDPALEWLYESHSKSTLVVAEESWESIFDPVKKKKPDQYPSAATLPHLMPTPPLKPSPVITINEGLSRCESQTFGSNYDILQQIRASKEQDFETQPPKTPTPWTEKRLFWLGFACPLLWFFASVRTPHDYLWQKRCRLAALYFCISILIVVLVFIAGALTNRQSQTNTIPAIIAN